MFARILIAQNKLEEAGGLLQRVVGPAEESGRKTSVIEILILKALAYQAGGNINQAMIPLERALKLAEPLGYFRIFMDEGPPMARLLNGALSHEISPQYVRRLLDASGDADIVKIEPSKPLVRKSELVEPLSDREIEVIQLIAEGLTNQEIASRLYLSLNTVKVHTRNIYGKLGVTSRMQAVARAIGLGILPST